jgi:molybdate transport system permease protein
LGGLLALYLAAPLVYFLYRLAEPGDRGFETPGLWSALWTSVMSATIATGLVAVFGIPMAYWLARSSGPLARVVGLLVLLPIAMPPVMSGIVLIYLVGPYTFLGQLFNGGLTDSVAGVVIAQSFVAGPFLVIAARSAFAGVDTALEDLAASLGHRPAARFWLVSMRIAAPGIRAGLLMTWLRAIGEYGATVLLAYHPYTLPVFTYVQFSSTGIPTTQAPTALALAVAVIILLASESRFPWGRLVPTVNQPGPADGPASTAGRAAAALRPANLITARGARRGSRGIPAPAPPRPMAPTRVSVDLDAEVGGFRLRLAHDAGSHRIAILGPSGAGKSMTLRAIAGFLGPQAGEVSLGGERVDRVPVERRGIGYVPQGLALFPDRTVWEQVLFAVGADPGLAAWWLGTLHLDGLAGRRPQQLSGGQRQRVALARALAFSPRLVLLDEPFNALDAPVREELRREVRRLQRETGLSTVLVTHDPEEAALLADEILVVDDGRLLQAGPRAEVFARPASPQVARLLGIPNLTHGSVAAPGLLAVGRLLITAQTGSLSSGTPVLWTIRPDHITVTRGADDQPDGSAVASRDDGFGTGAGPLTGRYPAAVEDVADIGTLTTLTVRLPGGEELRVRTTAAIDLAPGDRCTVRLAPDDITAWPAGGEQVPLAADVHSPVG